LLNQLQQNTRIVWLTGLSGIGKTTLGECIAVKAWENDPSFQWLHLEISASQLPDFATGAREILSQLGEKELDPQEMNDPKRLGDRLLQKLQSSFYWLQIDALEKLISANEFIDSYWLIFLESCLNTNHFSSRLLLTSQVLPNSLINWCDRFSNIWHQETLKGLENEESEQYFSKNGIVIDESNQDILTGISQTYEGHPLVLQVITGEILQVYQGDVTTYWQVNQAEFEQVSRELKSSRLTETEYNEQLARRVRERVKKSLEQLPEKAIALLCRSAVYRRPVLKKFWLDLMMEYSPKEQLEAYRVLGDRALVETERNLIRLHNLVRDISYDWLREDKDIWKAAEVKAAELWLSDYQPEENAENLEKIRGYLEAFYHYCDLKNWDAASKIFVTPLENLHTPLYNLLYLWSYYEEAVNFCYHLLDKSTKNIDIICLNTLSNIYSDVGKYDMGIELANRSLMLAREIDDQLSKAIALISLSRGFRNSNKYNDAIISCQEALEIYSDRKDIYGISSVIDKLAVLNFYLGNIKEAMEYHHQALKLLPNIDDAHQRGVVIGNFAITLIKDKQYQEAREKLKEALLLFEKLGTRSDIAETFRYLAECYYKQDKPDYLQANQYCKKALKITKEIGITSVKWFQQCQELLSKIEEEAMNAQEN
jgi:tetratricopeptide (TPR) repeat protein